MVKLPLAIPSVWEYNVYTYMQKAYYPRVKEMEATMPKYVKWLLIEMVIFAVVITGVIALEVLVIQPHTTVSTHMPSDGSFTIRQMESGELEITWPKADQADYYLFELYQLPNDGQLNYQHDAGKLMYELPVYDGTRLVLPSDAYVGCMLFKVRSVVTYEYNGVVHTRYSDEAVEAVTHFQPPTIENIICTTNPAKQTAQVNLELLNSNACDVFVVDANGKQILLKTVSQGTVSLQFGPEGDLPMPAFDQGYQLRFTVYRKGNGVTYYSADYADFFIDRNMLVPSDIRLSHAISDDGCRLFWEPEDCDFYELQYFHLESNSWKLWDSVDKEEELTYLFTNLAPGQVLIIRVAAAYWDENIDSSGNLTKEVKYCGFSNEIGVKLLDLQAD